MYNHLFCLILNNWQIWNLNVNQARARMFCNDWLNPLCDVTYRDSSWKWSGLYFSWSVIFFPLPLCCHLQTLKLCMVWKISSQTSQEPPRLHPTTSWEVEELCSLPQMSTRAPEELAPLLHALTGWIQLPEVKKKMMSYLTSRYKKMFPGQISTKACTSQHCCLLLLNIWQFEIKKKIIISCLCDWLLHM